MKELPIVTVPNDKLLKPAKPVTIFDDSLANVARQMVEVLRKHSDDGIGLAANQLGFNQSLFVVEYIDSDGKEIIPLQFFANPKIIKKSDEQEITEEGCLSVPNIFLPIERSQKILFKAQNLNGKIVKLAASKLFARLVQHEENHLRGILFTDLAREKLLSKFPHVQKLKIIFIGSGNFAEIIARGLMLMNLNIPLIITEKSKPSGRGKQMRQTPVAITALDFGKKIIETDDIKSNVKEIAKLNPDLIILADFGQLIPQEILDIPKIAAINCHPSLLPKYRGPTPIQTAILRGEKETGVSIIKMSAKIDKGEVISQNAIDINKTDNSSSLEIRLANLSLRMLLDFLPQLQKGKIQGIRQDEALSSKTEKFSKNDGKINWRKSVRYIERQIRAFYPWPGSFTFIDGKRLIIHQAHLDGRQLVLDIVQSEGKKPMSFSEFIKGYRGQRPDWFKKLKK